MIRLLIALTCLTAIVVGIATLLARVTVTITIAENKVHASTP